MKVKEESEKVGLNLNIQKTKIMASSPVTSWEIDGETVETVADFFAPAEGEGHEGFPPPPDKDLKSPSSTRLEALVPSRDSRARTRSPSPRAWRPDFPGAAREAP